MVKFDFTHIFDTVIEYQHKNNQEERAKRKRTKKNSEINPSSLGYCLRKQVLSPMGNTPDKDLKKIFWHGNFIHDDMVFPVLKEYYNELSDEGYWVYNEMWLDMKVIHNGVTLNFRAYVDDVLIKGEEQYPIEVKSIGNKFYKLKEGIMIHQVQLMCYLGLLKADKGSLLYVHKAGLDIKQFEYTYDEDIYNGLLDRAVRLVEYKERGVIPYAEALVEAKNGDYWFKKEDQCTNCDFLGFCIDNEEEIQDD